MNLLRKELIPEPDAIVYTYTSPSSIISQLKANITALETVYNPQEAYILSTLKDAQTHFIKAQERWEEVQQDVRCKLRIIQGKRKEQKHILETKILRYRILERYGKRVWLKTLALADLGDLYLGEPNLEEPNLEEPNLGDLDLETGDNVIHQIARDLLDNKLGFWKSEDMEMWRRILQDLRD